MAAAVCGALILAGAVPEPRLPARIHRIVLHVPGGPSYDRPARRFVFLTPPATQALWARNFGAHWIVWTDGALWPRHPRAGDPPSILPPVDAPAEASWRRRVAEGAAPVYSHLYLGNGDSLGIEVSHSGRSGDPFPPSQVRALAWLLRTLIGMSDGRLGEASVFGHKDLDERPAYVDERCVRRGCAVYADDEGLPYRRRVDPPESLFAALRQEGLVVPRPTADADRELKRAEAIPKGAVPRAVTP